MWSRGYRDFSPNKEGEDGSDLVSGLQMTRDSRSVTLRWLLVLSTDTVPRIQEGITTGRGHHWFRPKGGTTTVIDYVVSEGVVGVTRGRVSKGKSREGEGCGTRVKNPRVVFTHKIK